MDKSESDSINEQDTIAGKSEKSIWPRVLYMILFAIAFGISETVLYLIAFVNLVFVLIKKEVHKGLLQFGNSLASYLQQIARYLTFNTEYVPFPFNEWPSAPVSKPGNDGKGESKDVDETHA